jgi:hypothetical protein
MLPLTRSHTDQRWQSTKPKRKTRGGMSQMWPCHLHEKSMYLKKAKEELWRFKIWRIMETQIFHGAKIIIFQKKSSQRNQNPSRYYNFVVTNLKFQHNSQNIIFQKILIIKIDLLLLLLPRGQNPLIYYIYILYNESKHNILASVGKAKKIKNKKSLVITQAWRKHHLY